MRKHQILLSEKEAFFIWSIIAWWRPTHVLMSKLYFCFGDVGRAKWSKHFGENHELPRFLEVAESIKRHPEWLKGLNVDIKESERIICAAIRTKRNVIIRGHRHSDCIRAASSRPHITQDDIQYRAEGFITSSGRFVQRVEAMKIAIAAGQYTAEKGRDKLYSEDIY